MKRFLKKNKVLLAIIIGALIVVVAVYYLPRQNKNFEIYKGELKETCENIPDLPDETIKLVTKIIDGDTFLIEGGYSVRILGIDADERGYPCYEAAKTGLEKLILNKQVKLIKGKEDKDQYCRYLRYVFLDGKNISLELIKNGLVVARFSPEDIKYRKEIIQAEKEARKNKIGCKWSFSKVLKEKNREIDWRWKSLISEKIGLEVIGACSAGKYLGKEVIVEGKVVDTYRSIKTNTVFLNFEKPYPTQCFTAVIFNSDLYKFVQNPEDFYLGKTVRVVGKIKKYKGRAEIILKDPSQIEIGR